MHSLRLLILIGGILLPTGVLFAHHQEPIRVTSTDQTIDFELSVGDQAGGANIALADLGNDGISEVLVAGGLGSEPRVRVLRQDGTQIGSFLAYAPTLGVGISVIACDVTGDGFNEIVTAPQKGGGPHIRVFDRYGKEIDDGGFFAYEESFREGVNLACGDLLGDGRAEIVTLPAAGGGPHVRVWSFENARATLEKNFFAFHVNDRSGVAGDVYDKKLFLAQQFTSTPMIKTIVIHNMFEVLHEEIFSISELGVTSLFVHDEAVHLATATGSTLIATHTGEETFIDSHYGSIVAATDRSTILTAPTRPMFTRDTEEKRIEVSITEQRLFAYKSGVLANSFLISSGRNSATPVGDFTVLAKIDEVHYAWNYGEGNPNNYDLGWIPYNLRFYPHIYIHYAPWHNNFGHQMSRGCVNVGLEDVQWIYGWAEEGIPIRVYE